MNNDTLSPAQMDNDTLSPAQMDKHLFLVYLLLFEPKTDVSEKTLEPILHQLYDLRRVIPDVMTVRIQKNILLTQPRYACVINYANTQALDQLLNHLAYKAASTAVHQVSQSVTEFATKLGYFYAPREGISIRLNTPKEERLKKTVEERLKLVVRDELHLAEQHVILDASWVTDLDADVMDIVALIDAIEDEFEISIKDEDMQKLVTTRDVLNFLAQKGIQ